MLMVFPEMIDGRIDHDLSKPSFKGADCVGISWFETVDFDKDFQEAVIEDFVGIFFVSGISVADRHGISIERAI